MSPSLLSPPENRPKPTVPAHFNLFLQITTDSLPATQLLNNACVHSSEHIDEFANTSNRHITETCYLFVYTIPATTASSISLPDMSRRKSSQAAPCASYVVRVHTRHGIKTLSFDMLAHLFTFTAKKAAEDLGISSRTLIRVCRSLGIQRWPYLGFRSEKNVDRIRKEALENLRHKLEKLGVSSVPTAVLDSNATSLRGASAKRLLQVTMSQLVLPPPGAAAPPELSVVRSSSWCPSPTLSNTTTNVSDDEGCMSESNESSFMAKASLVSPLFSQADPLQTPPTMHGLILDIHRVRQSKEATTTSSATGPCRKNIPWIVPRVPVQAKAPSRLALPAMPSLDLLVDASILKSFKNDTASMGPIREGSTQQPRQLHARPRMSMQDILALSH